MTATVAPNVDRSDTSGIDFEVTDVTGYRAMRVTAYPPDHTIGEMVRTLVSRMELTTTNPAGVDYTYHARLEREGRHLNASELVGEAVRPGDRLSLQPNIDAGC
jgi:hypothetical protein